VRSPADGVVSFAGTVAGRGVIVISHHRGGQQLVRSSFEPVRPLLTAGRPVAEGQIIAQVASPGTPAAGTPGGHCLAPVCLHWGVRIGASYVDPMGMLGIRPVVLLPLDAVR
jgi:murein DD-endopeptidase MepM/ murein hydrolase activator NlpD